MQISTLTRITRNAASSYANHTASVLVGLLLTPFLVHGLGDARFGIWTLVFSVAAYFGILDLGIGQAVVKYVAEYHARRECDRLNELLSTAFVAFLGLGGIIFGLSAALALVLPTLFRVPPQHEAEARLMVILMGGTLFLQFPFAIFAGVLAGLQRYEVEKGIGAAMWVTNGVLSLAVLAVGGGLLGLTAVWSTVILSGRAAQFVAARRYYAELRLAPSLVSRASTRSLTGFSIWLFLLQLGRQVSLNSDPLVIAALLGPAAVAPYAIGSKLANALRMAPEPFIAILVPIFSRLHALDGRTRVQEGYLMATRAVLTLALPVAAALWFTAPGLIQVWVGERYVEQSSVITRVLLLAFVSIVSVAPVTPVITAVQPPRALSALTTVAALLNAAASLLLVSQVGLVGAAFGTLLTNGVLGLLLFPYACRQLGIPLAQLGRRALLPVALPLVPPLAIGWVLSGFVGRDLASTLALGLSILAGYLGSYVVLGLSAGERARVGAILRGVAHRPAPVWE